MQNVAFFSSLAMYAAMPWHSHHLFFHMYLFACIYSAHLNFIIRPFFLECVCVREEARIFPYQHLNAAIYQSI